MNPRTLLNFFKSKSGKFALFALLLAGGLMLFGSARSRSVASRQPVSISPADLDISTNKNQVVESVSKPMEVFRPRLFLGVAAGEDWRLFDVEEGEGRVVLGEPRDLDWLHFSR